MKPIYLYGCGGHGKAILDILRRQGPTVAAFVADTPPADITQLHGIPVHPTTPQHYSCDRTGASHMKI
jgi:UDP-N-acetylmuramoylalanine-D-glutamate ligase